MSGWVKATLGDVCHVYQPQTLAQKQLRPGPFPVYGANGQIGWHDEFNHEDSQLLLGCRGSVGTVHVTYGRCWINGNAMVVAPAEGIIERDFLAYALKGGVAISSAITGAAQPQITRTSLNPIPISYPNDRLEQRRIITLLDEAFADIATANANAEKNLQNARELLDSHIQSVFTDKSQKWPSRLLGDVFDIGSSKRIYEADWTTQGVPFFGGKEIVKLAKFGSVESASFISEDKYQEYASKYEMPKAGDILMTARGTIGVGYIVQPGDKFYYKDGNVISLRAKTPSNPQFVLFAFKTHAILDQLTLLVGTTVSHLPIEKAKMLKICLPDLVEQNFLVDHLQKVERQSKKLESIYRQKLTALDDLKKSLLHQAFSEQL